MQSEDQELIDFLNWNQNEIALLKNNLNFLKGLNTNVVSAIFGQLLSKVPLSRHSVQGKIIRCRPNEDNGDFYKVSQLSYNTECPEKIKMGRFNLDREAMFYGAIPNGSPLSNPAITSCLESFPNIRIGDGIEEYKDFTFSIWEADEFDVFDLTFDRDQANPFKERIDFFSSHIKSSSQKKVAEIIFDFLSFISELCSATSNSPIDYFLSNILLDSINQIQYRDMQKNKGLIYPSSRADRKGTNIVLYPDAVKEHLKMDSAVVMRVYRRHNEKVYDFIPISNIAKVEDSEFKIERSSQDKIDEEYSRLILQPQVVV